MLYLLCVVAQSPPRVMIEELTPVTDVTVRVRCEEEPAPVTLVPSDRPVCTGPATLRCLGCESADDGSSPCGGFRGNEEAVGIWKALSTVLSL